MVRLYDSGVIWKNGRPEEADASADMKNREKTIAGRILASHRTGTATDGHDRGGGKISLKFDALASHDITYVGIIQTARASGLEEFPVPYVLTNCHNSLCAVGGTINEDDHRFGLSCAKKYGGIYVPPHVAVIHQYMREMFAGCGKMIIGSDSHTRYGALGTMAVGEGGPELVKQLLGRPYEVADPEIVCVYLEGSPAPGTGPQDVAIALIKATFGNGFVKNKVMEFTGPGVKSLSVEFRIGIDVMTTETTCWSSVWQTDEKVKEYLGIHGRAGDYAPLEPEEGAYYDSLIRLDLSAVRPMIALPFHPSNAFTVRDFLADAPDILRETEKAGQKQFGAAVRDGALTSKFRDGAFYADQGVIAGCSGGTFENIRRAAGIIGGGNIGTGAYSLSIYPASEPVYLELMKNGALAALTRAGATVRSCFCGPCFGAGDVPANNSFSIRHTTRNFPNREGSKPGEGQSAWVALMDAASIAATSLHGGKLTPADEVAEEAYGSGALDYRFDETVYSNRVYNGWGRPDRDAALEFGPNISDWPAMEALGDDLLLMVCSVICDPVTTTDELIPSGETSSYRSNPERLSRFALSRKDPGYVGRCLEIRGRDLPLSDTGITPTGRVQSGSVICVRKPGDGSAREQAASCQKVLGGLANISEAYATKRYRSNLINWGMLPFTLPSIDGAGFENGDRIYVPGIRKLIEQSGEHEIGPVKAVHIRSNGEKKELELSLGILSETEKKIILSGCLINYYNEGKKQ